MEPKLKGMGMEWSTQCAWNIKWLVKQYEMIMKNI